VGDIKVDPLRPTDGIKGRVFPASTFSMDTTPPHLVRPIRIPVDLTHAPAAPNVPPTPGLTGLFERTMVLPQGDATPPQPAMGYFVREFQKLI
jgi:hypothetical protein